MRIKSIKFIDDFKMFPKGTEYSFGEKLNVIKGKGGTGKSTMSGILFKLAAGNKLSFVEVEFHDKRKFSDDDEGYYNFPVIIDNFFTIMDEVEVKIFLNLFAEKYTHLFSKQVIICLRLPCYYEGLFDSEDVHCINMPG